MSLIRKHYFPLLLLMVGVSLIYSNALDGGFQFDDLQIRDRPNLRITKLDAQSLKGALYWSPAQRKVYRPLPCLTLAVNYYFGRDNTFGYHLVNVMVHSLCAMAVYVFFQKLLSVPGVKPDYAAKYKHEIAIIGSFLFAFHPIQTNVATYIIQRMTSMAALFYLISIICYICWRLGTVKDKKEFSLYDHFPLLGAIISGGVSFLCKQNAAILPMTILVCDYLLFYPLCNEKRKKALKRVYAVSVLFLLLLISYGGIKPLLSFVHGYENRDFTLTERLLTQPRIVFFYLYLLLIPNINLLNLNHDILISESLINPPQTIFAILAIGTLLIIAYSFRKKWNLLSFAILWYLGNLIIESTIIPLELIYEHRTYLPGVMVFLMISLAIVYVSRSIVKREKFILITSLLLIVYGNGTFTRNFVFQTTLSMWHDVSQKSPNLARAHANLGKAYMDLGYDREAKKSLEMAIQMKPDMPEALVNLGKLYFERFDLRDQAMKLFKRALRATPNTVIGCMALGDCYMILQNYEKAEHFYEIALKRVRPYIPAINNLGIAKIHLGKEEEAIKLFQWGIRVQPTHEAFYLNLAKLHANENRFSNAIDALRQYRVINSESKQAEGLLRAIEEKANAAKLVKG